jgi:hypothetical protein
MTVSNSLISWSMFGQKFPVKFATAVLVLAILALNVAAQEAPKSSQKQGAKAPAEKSAPKSGYTLTVKSKPILHLSLKAEKARMTDVAAELSQKLKLPVMVGEKLQQELISVEFSELTLEPALQLMAPAVYVDYEIDIGSAAAPKPLGIFFYDTTEGEPPLNAVVKGSTQSLLVEGDTEDGVEPATEEAKKKQEEQPLRVRFENNNLSVKAKKQPLPLVLLKIGEELGIPVDIQYQPTDIIDTDITRLPVEDAVRQLSPNIRLFIRADLTRAERRALRLVLAESGKTGPTGF